MSEVLHSFGVKPDDLIGAGDEARVYSLGPDRVLRVYRTPASLDQLSHRLRFYEAIASSRALFQTPRMLEVGELGGEAYSVERRLPGTSLASALPTLGGRARMRAFASYVEAAGAIQSLPRPQNHIGEVLSDEPMHRASWPEFLVARAQAELDKHRGRLHGLVAPERALRTLQQLADANVAGGISLVHGDFFPHNVLVDEGGAVSAVIDFGSLTLVGDPRLDVSCSLLFLTGLAGITPSDRSFVQQRVRLLGVDDEVTSLYSLYYAFRLLGVTRDQEGMLGWCAKQISMACVCSR